MMSYTPLHPQQRQHQPRRLEECCCALFHLFGTRCCETGGFCCNGSVAIVSVATPWPECMPTRRKCGARSTRSNICAVIWMSAQSDPLWPDCMSGISLISRRARARIGRQASIIKVYSPVTDVRKWRPISCASDGHSAVRLDPGFIYAGIYLVNAGRNNRADRMEPYAR